MRLDRNLSTDGDGKYRLWNKRINDWDPDQDLGGENEFFLIKLKDRGSKAALLAYAAEFVETDPEWADDVREMASRAGIDHPFCKEPD